MKKFFTKLGIKLTKKWLLWLRDNKHLSFDLDGNDINDLNEWIDWLDKVQEKIGK